ncbi:MAG: alpha/beta hydrolase [Proteobacteria bacterium]|uniref:Alpha/beta hydrolase n=1 Tax=Candidatus Avisuccinivibrio stercorigallinarum TaxID=2840704 RepID=A0A9D9GV48_9GAMM|nr:alpha/beta hydrolase [Candidatus Avisuccinivibrio stercorigallinarum]
MTDESHLNENLSEVLFKPQRTSLETSLISNSGCPLPDIDYALQSHFGFQKNWYRPVNRFYWTWLGGNLLDIDEALSNIAVSTNKRTRPQCLDTVEEYGPGNWIYEFSAIAQKRVLMAGKAGDPELKAHHLRLASRYFAIAAYPNLKGDVLAAEAAMHSRRHYREVFETSKVCGYYSTETFDYKGSKINAYLHSPDNTELHPCVVVVCSYEQSCTDYFRFFNDYLRPHGMAVLVIEMPGLGSCANIKLDASCSDFIQAAVEHIDKLPFIDSSNIGIFAGGLAALAALRLAILQPALLKGVSVVNPIIDNVFNHPEVMMNVPLCLRSSFANRMDLDASNWDTVVPQTQIFSLKKQGLLTAVAKLNTPVLCHYIKELKITAEDAKLIERSFKNADCRPLETADVSGGSFQTFKRTTEFFIKRFGLN